MSTNYKMWELNFAIDDFLGNFLKENENLKLNSPSNKFHLERNEIIGTDAMKLSMDMYINQEKKYIFNLERKYKDTSHIKYDFNILDLQYNTVSHDEKVI